MKMVDEILFACISIQDVLGPADEDQAPYDQENNHDCPKYGNKNDSALIGQDAY
jgi:hypothetical protein